MSNTSGRVASIDILRCIAIIGMVLSSNIGFYSDLPGWMYHAQVPPPDYVFRPECAGISWVDLVFPFFLVSMGAALPFSLKKRLARGVPTPKLILGIFSRWLILTTFAVVLGNAYKIGGSPAPVWAHALMRFAVWAGLFLSLVHFRKPRKRLQTILNISGIAVLAIDALLLDRVFGVQLGLESDVIIMILAEASLFGALLYLISKDNPGLRFLIIGFIAAIKAVCAYTPEALAFVPKIGAGIGWFFQWSYLQYLIPVLLGSAAGDLLLSKQSTTAMPKVMWITLSIIPIALIFTQLWGLYTRRVLADGLITLALFAVFAILSWKHRGEVWVRLGNLGCLLSLFGVIFDPVDGGIAKDYCNLSYLFLTSGLALALISSLLCLETKAGVKAPFMSAVGQNPMIAYTITNFILLPLLVLLGIAPFFDALSVGSPFWGVTKGVLITALMMLCTAGFTKAGVFWKS